MTDRPLVYAGALPQTQDILNAGKMAMLGDAFLAMAALGNSGSNPSTVVAGLACVPTGPASLQVVVGPGAIFQVDPTDATAYGDLGTDSTNIFKMGIRANAGNLTITPPSTTGYSQVFLVQAILSDIDSGAQVLSYYNAANPAIPLSGPANAGTSQYTQRTCVATVSLKAGVAATTGTQTNPSPDAGYTALYYITVANGATQIISNNIVAANAGFAPFVNTALPYIPNAVQSGVWQFGTDTGTADALAVTLAPIPSAYNHMVVWVKKSAAANATTTPTINVNGLGNKTIIRADGSALAAGDLPANGVFELAYDGTNFRLMTTPVSTTTAITNLFYSLQFPYFTLQQAAGTVSMPDSTNTIIPLTFDAGHYFRDAGSNLNSSHPYAFTCGAQDAGLWLFIGTFGVAAPSSPQTQINVAIAKNGGTPTPYQSILVQATIGTHMTYVIRMAAGEYVQLSGFQNSGSSQPQSQGQLLGIRLGS